MILPITPVRSITLNTKKYREPGCSTARNLKNVATAGEQKQQETSVIVTIGQESRGLLNTMNRY
jgi:hypothetical protein